MIINGQYRVIVNNQLIYQQASVWAEQLKTDPAFTNSDAEELKGHLIDLSFELTEKGLNEEEAFLIAASRLGDTSQLKTEFEEVNTSIIQMRKIILVLSGILAYFFLYFLMITSTRLLFFLLNRSKIDSVNSIKFTFYYVIAFHAFVIISHLIIYFNGKKLINKIADIKIKPQYTFVLFSGVFSLCVADQFFRMAIKSAIKIGTYSHRHLYYIFDYSAYSFPLILILCFIVLYKKYYLTIKQLSIDSELSNELQVSSGITNSILETGCDPEPKMKDQSNDQMKELVQIGLDDDEAKWIIFKRQGLITPKTKDFNSVNKPGSQMYLLLNILSGGLTYFFFYFLLYSSARILFTVLQHFEDNALLNIKRTWSYVIIYQLLFVFFTASLYFLDTKLVQHIKRIHLNPKHVFWIFMTVVVLAITDRCFYPISRQSIYQNREMLVKLNNIFYYSGYSFLFILSACFLVLFYKYYRDNIKIS